MRIPYRLFTCLNLESLLVTTLYMGLLKINRIILILADWCCNTIGEITCSILAIRRGSRHYRTSCYNLAVPECLVRVGSIGSMHESLSKSRRKSPRVVVATSYYSSSPFHCSQFSISLHWEERRRHNSPPNLYKHGLNATIPIPVGQDRQLRRVDRSVRGVHKRQINTREELNRR